MELRALRVFVEVVRQGGFSQAAKIVFATQSTVSKAVKQLEDEIGMPLLDRLGRRNALTAAGEVVYRRALKMLAERDDLVAELAELRGLGRGTLRLGLPAVASSTVFAPVFLAYRKRYPSIEVRLVEHGGERLEEILRAGEIDLAASLLPVSDEFEWQEFRTEPMIVLVPSGATIAREASLDLLRLKDSPFILFEPGFAVNRLILDACGRRGFEPTVAARSSQVDFIAELVAGDVGIAFLPRMMARKLDHPALRCILLDEPQTECRMVMIWRRGAYLSQAAQAWLSLWREIDPATDDRESRTPGDRDAKPL